MDNLCSICGCNYDTYTFKGGYVCESCLNFVKENFGPDQWVED
ncbi:MAG: hypothetical protein PHS19_05085 [Eubacteriales bacterium]|nr:hypothetical protein [Eubacteriales bacterium]